MKKTTSKKLSERLTQYGTLTLAIAGITEGIGQNIIHVDLSPNYLDGGVDNSPSSYALNLDPDSFVDFNINGLSAPAVTITADPGFNSFLGNGATIKYAAALYDLDPINSSQNTWINAYNYPGVLNFVSCFAGSHWCDKQNRYLGVRFKIGAETRYGWIKLDVNASGSSFTIKEYAYVDTPDVGLTAGQTVLGVDDKDLRNIKVVALNKSVGLYNLSETTNYSIFNMSGKMVLNGNTDQKDYVIEATSLASGIYIVELKDPKSNATMKKKIVLQ